MATANIDINIDKERVHISSAALGRLSKLQEIELVKGLALHLPDSYLRDTLKHIQIQFEHHTMSDFPCIPNLHLIEMEIREQEEVRSKLVAEINRMKNFKDELRTELRKLRAVANVTADGILKDAERLEHCAKSLRKSLADAPQS